MSLSEFPTDELTLSMIEASLEYCLTVDDNGDPVPVDPDVVSLSQLLDFLAGVSTDPLGVIQYEGEIDTPWGRADLTYDPRPHYTEASVIRALIAEVRRLRGEQDGLPPRM